MSEIMLKDLKPLQQSAVAMPSSLSDAQFLILSPLIRCPFSQLLSTGSHPSTPTDSQLITEVQEGHRKTKKIKGSESECLGTCVSVFPQLLLMPREEFST